MNHKLLLTSALFFVCFGLLLIFQSQNLGQLRIIACDVGQGDGILLISSSGKQILVDGGPGTKIADCLSQKMPFWDRTVEMVVLTHPERDHLEGLLEVLARYKVKMIMTTGVVNDTELFRAWQKAIGDEGAKIYTPKAGDRLVIDSISGRTLSMDVLWPTSEKLAIWKIVPPTELNESSIVLKVNLGPSVFDPEAQTRRADGFCAYLVGDIPRETLEKVLTGKCQVLKISHHGSKTGTNQAILDSVDPKIAIIQVGKNSFGQPSKEVIDLLESKGVNIYRNDLNSIIEISTNGKNLNVKSERKINR